MAKKRAGGSRIPIPWTVWTAAAAIAVYSLYLFVFTWAAWGRANLLEGVVLAFTLLVSALILAGIPFSRVLILSWSILSGIFLLVTLFLADLHSAKSGLETVGLVSRLLMPPINLGAALLLFHPSAADYSRRKTAARSARR